MKRQRGMKMQKYLFVLIVVLIGRSARAEDAPRPNILWITCEDASPNLGCYGDQYAITPHLDRLAAEGVRYTHAFTVAGVCAPSRSCLITGMYPSTIGSQHMRSTTRLPEGIKCFTEYLRQAGYYCSNNSKEDYNFKTPASAWDESSTKAHWRKRPAGHPFFAVFNFTTTHESHIRLDDAAFAKRTAALSDGERHDPAKAPVPRYHPDTPVVRRDWARYYDLITVMDQQAGELLAQLAADGLAEDTIVFFFSDHGVGLPRGKRWLYDSGLRVPLMIRFPPQYQHLAPGGPGTTCDRLVSFVDFAPTVLSLAGVALPEQLQGTAFLGEQAGSPREYIYGIRDRMDERYDLTRAVRHRRWKYLRNYRPELPYAQPIEYMEEMPTMREWRRLVSEGKLDGPSALFMQPTKPVEELYDTEADPDEVDNLASSEKHRDVLDRLRGEHGRWVRETHDLGFLPEAEMWRRVGERTPYELGRDRDSYPQDRILAAAQRTRVEPNELAELLADGDAAVRWWTLIRLSPRQDGLNNQLSSLERALTDESPTVRLAAADIACGVGNSQRALQVLEKGLIASEPYLRLDAANRLDQLAERAAPAKEAMREAVRDPNGDVQKVLRHALR
ncbi:MAG TPA: sulfatase-like hydrolase/transferase [Pirellulales bacterium]|nr:sulfatase-like hydrolase/transferase [Pirellulales bacterium]